MPSKKLCTNHKSHLQTETESIQQDLQRPSHHLHIKQEQGDKAEEGKQEEKDAEKEDQEEALEELEEKDDKEDHDHMQGQPQVSRSLPFRKVQQKSYTLDKKEVPQEMQIFIWEMKRFFTHQVNLERQPKPLVISTYQKAHDRISCELFYKFRKHSFDGFIVFFIYAITLSFSCLQVS